MMKRSCVLLLLSGCMWYEPSYKIGQPIEVSSDICSMNYYQVLEKLGPPSFESQEEGHALHYYSQEVKKGKPQQEQYIKVMIDENSRVSKVIIKEIGAGKKDEVQGSS